jgi:hypothetical protein
MTDLVRPGALSRPSDGPVVLVAGVGGATGAKPAAAALACAASEADRAALLIDLTDAGLPRPSLIATAGARELEERLAVHMPEAAVASRGRFCRLTLPAGPSGVEQLPAALPLARESAAVVHLPPSLWGQVLMHPQIPASAALVRADLRTDHALTALTVRDLIDEGLRVAVLKYPLPWLAARAALLGALPTSTPGLPAWIHPRLTRSDDKRFQQCYDPTNGAEDEQRQIGREQR